MAVQKIGNYYFLRKQGCDKPCFFIIKSFIKNGWGYLLFHSRKLGQKLFYFFQLFIYIFFIGVQPPQLATTNDEAQRSREEKSRGALCFSPLSPQRRVAERSEATRRRARGRYNRATLDRNDEWRSVAQPRGEGQGSELFLFLIKSYGSQSHFLIVFALILFFQQQGCGKVDNPVFALIFFVLVVGLWESGKVQLFLIYILKFVYLNQSKNY